MEATLKVLKIIYFIIWIPIGIVLLTLIIAIATSSQFRQNFGPGQMTRFGPPDDLDQNLGPDFEPDSKPSGEDFSPFD